MRHIFSQGLASSIALVAAVNAAPASAQQAGASVLSAGPDGPPGAPGAAASDQASTPAVGEIIVTAQRREQSLQQVPVAVSAVSGAQLQVRRIANVDQMSGLAPNLTIEAGNTTSSSIQVAMRGNVTSNAALVYDPAVGIYLDGIYVGKGSGAVFDIGDLERVEVLRGPQGTLFGRNTLAGAISFTTRKPSDALRVEGEVSYGNLNYMQARGLLNVPITPNLFVKLSGQLQKRDGFTRAVPDPQGQFHTASGRLDDLDRSSIMAQVRWAPMDRLTVDYSYDLSHTDEHPLTALVKVGQGNIFDPASPFYLGLPLGSYVVPDDKRPDTVSVDVLSHDTSRVYGHGLTLDYDLGGAHIKSISAYRNVHVDDAPYKIDLDGSPLAIATGGYGLRFWQASQELQLTGSGFDRKLNYVAGAYFLKDSGQSFNPQTYFFGASAYDTAFGIKSRAIALYAQADYKLLDRLTITGGLRWTSERKQVTRFYAIDAITPNPGLVLPFTTINITDADNVHHTFSNVTPTAILAYEFSRNLNVYAKYTVGFRSGSYNGEATSAADVRTYYSPEKNRSYEAGIKSRFFDRRLTLNLAGFYQQQKDKQVPVFVAAGTLATINRNAGSAHIYGLEVEAEARPIDMVRIYGALGLLRAKFDTYFDTSASGATVNVASNRFFAKAPRTTANGGVDLTLAKGERGTVILGGDVRYQSKSYALPGQLNYDPSFPLVAVASDLGIPAQTIANARLRWDGIPLGSSGLKGYAMLWANNLTDFRKIVNKIAFGPNFGGIVNANYGPARTYGVTLGFKY